MLEEMVAQNLPHYGAIAMGTLLGIAANRHRGTTVLDRRRKVYVSNGDGWSSRIIRKVPSYRNWSSAIEHFCAGAGLTAAMGGLFASLPGVADEPNHAAIAYATAAVAYYAVEAVWHGWEACLRQGTRARFDAGDARQLAADVISPIAFLYPAHLAGLF